MRSVRAAIQSLVYSMPKIRILLAGMLPHHLKKRFAQQVFDHIDTAALRDFQERHRTEQVRSRSLDNGIAVIVPCYNHSRFLGATIESLVKQTLRPFTAVFVEDHSTDDTLSRIESLMTEIPEGIQAKLLRTARNMGQAAAINLGVQNCSASVIVILNDDDYMMHDALEAIMTIMHREKDVFLLGATSRVFGDNGESLPQDERLLIRSLETDYAQIDLTRYSSDDVLRMTHPNDLNMSHSGSAFLRSAWEAVGGYYTEKAHRVVTYSDRDFQLRVASVFPVAVSLRVPFSYWRSGSSVDGRLNS